MKIEGLTPDLSQYLKKHPEFVIDKSIEHKLPITVAPDGYLKRIKKQEK